MIERRSTPRSLTRCRRPPVASADSPQTQTYPRPSTLLSGSSSAAEPACAVPRTTICGAARWPNRCRRTRPAVPGSPSRRRPGVEGLQDRVQRRHRGLVGDEQLPGAGRWCSVRRTGGAEPHVVANPAPQRPREPGPLSPCTITSTSISAASGRIDRIVYQRISGRSASGIRATAVRTLTRSGSGNLSPHLPEPGRSG